MKNIVRPIAVALMGLGLIIMAIGVVTWQKASAGLASLDAVYEAQNVTLSYNDDGELVDRGEVQEAQAILSLVEDDWQFPLTRADLDPSDPLVNTPSELMYQFGVITYHVLHGTQTVTLDEDVTYEGEVFEAGTYEVAVDGRYWSDFNRSHPLDGKVRELAWSATAHGLLGELSAGLAADNLAGFAHFTGWRTVLEGFAILLAGAGLYAFALQKKQDEAPVDVREREFATTT